MLHHVPSWSSFSQGVMPGGHHPGFTAQDEGNLAMQESMAEREDAAHNYWEEYEFDLLLQSTMMHTAWYAAPLYTYAYREEDQFQDTIEQSWDRQSEPEPVNYNSPWSAPEVATPELKMAA